MEECPNCHHWTLVYYAPANHHKCQTCGFTVKEKYEKYIKRMDCAKGLISPSIHPEFKLSDVDDKTVRKEQP